MGYKKGGQPPGPMSVVAVIASVSSRDQPL
jgi:hypothetical protein